MKYLIALIYCLATITGTKAQHLAIGDTVPDMKIVNILNHASPTSSLSRLCGDKPTLLFFFSSGCSVCKRNIHMIDSIERTFPGKMNIILITDEKTTTIEALRKETNWFKKIAAPIVTADTVLSKKFHYLSVPHIVWLSRQRKVEAITGGRELTNGNVVKLAEGKPLNLAQKKEPVSKRQYMAVDPIMTYDYPEQHSNILKYSYFSGYRQDLASAMRQNPDYNGLVRVNFCNATVRSMYQWAFPELYPLHRTQLIFKDSIKHRGDPETKTGYYCYELLLKGTRDSAYKIVRKDLYDFFGYTGRIEQGPVTCYELRRLPGNRQFGSKATRPSKKEVGDKVVLSGYRMQNLVAFLMPLIKYKIVNETGVEEPLDLELPLECKDPFLLNQHLARYGLELVKTERIMNVLVIE